MENSTNWVNLTIAIGGVIGTFVTGIATIFLWRVTKILAHETRRMVQASSQPHVVATLDSNCWAINYFDLKVDNTGNATAYDIEVAFDPPLKTDISQANQQKAPLKRISVLKPNQGISSSLSHYGNLQGEKYTVHISWRRTPQDLQREENIYTIDMDDKEGISQLGSEPLVQVAKSIEKIEKSLAEIAKTTKNMK